MPGEITTAERIVIGLTVHKIELTGKEVELILYPDPANTGLIFLSTTGEGTAATRFRITGGILTLNIRGDKNLYLISNTAAQGCYVLVNTLK